MYFQPPRSPFSLVAPQASFADVQSRRSLGKGGFTLIELLAVIAIIAILTSIVLGSGRRASEAGKTARAKAELAALAAALESYRREHGDYPRTNDNAVLAQCLIGKLDPTGAPLENARRSEIEVAKFRFALASNPEVSADPFVSVSATLVDPWARPYRYAYKSAAPWKNPSFVLCSAGPDGADSAALLAGGYADTAATANADNLYANQN
jgi:prepilin-type N-terminal cleavage/methylation domain-containing protein